jgi:hypothetical protein
MLVAAARVQSRYKQFIYKTPVILWTLVLAARNKQAD